MHVSTADKTHHAFVYLLYIHDPCVLADIPGHAVFNDVAAMPSALSVVVVPNAIEQTKSVVNVYRGSNSIESPGMTPSLLVA
jgi:hypothetical protein